MNKVVYSISGEDNLGVEQEVFKAGFNASNNPSVSVGELEVDLVNTQVEPNPTLSGDESLLLSLKIGLQKFKLGGGTQVDPNPALEGTEPDLTSIKIGSDKFKIASTDPAVESAKEIYGMAYVISGENEEVVTWDGSTEGKESWEFSQGTGYLIEDTFCAVTGKDFIGATLIITDGTNDTTVTVTEDQVIDIFEVGLCAIMLPDNFWPIISVTSPMTVPGGSSVVSPGLYFLKFTDNPNKFVKSLTFKPSELSKISSNNIASGVMTPEGNVLTADGNGNAIWAAPQGGGGLPTPANAGDAMIYNGTEWTKLSGYGYVKDAEVLEDITWDGDSTGKESTYVVIQEVFEFRFTKLSSNYYTPQQVLGSNLELTMLISGGSSTMLSLLDIQTPGLNEGVSWYYSEKDGIPFVVVSSVTATEQFSGFTFNFTPGVWLLWLNEDSIGYVSKLSIGTPEEIIKIDKKFVFPDSNLLSGLINVGGQWLSTPNYAGKFNPEEYEFTWDGSTEGKPSTNIQFPSGSAVLYRITNSLPKAALSFEGANVVLSNDKTGLLVDIKDVGFEGREGFGKVGGNKLYQGYVSIETEETHAIFICYESCEFWGANFTPGVWLNKPNNQYIQQLTTVGDSQYIKFDSRYIPIDINSTMYTGSFTKIKTFKFGDTTYEIADVVANPSLETGNTLTKILIGNGYYNVGTTVEANPTTSASDSLSKLKVDNTIYSVGGTNVVANPSGTTDVTLEKLQVGNGVYRIGPSVSHLKEFTVRGSSESGFYYYITGKYYSNNTNNYDLDSFSEFLEDIYNNGNKVIDIHGKYKENSSAQEITISSIYSLWLDEYISMSLYYIKEFTSSSTHMYEEEHIRDIVDEEVSNLDMEIIY